MKRKSEKIKQALLFLFLNFAGSYVYAVGIQVFTKPHHIAPGGITGLATIINYLWGLPIGVMVFLINVPLLILAAIYVTRVFAVRTTLSILIFSLCTDLLVTWMPEYPSSSDVAPLLASLFGGVLMGLGNALVYMSRSTTGGTAIISVLLQRKFPHLSMAKLLSLANFSIVIVAIFAYKNIDAAIFAIIAIYVSGIAMDDVIYGFNTKRLLFIISDKSDEIEDRILHNIHRGVTILKGEGAYGHKKKNVIFCVVNKAQFFKVKEEALAIDSRAFIVGCQADDVMGKGFKKVSI